MPDPKGFILGFDPGGAGHFGWSICETVMANYDHPQKTESAWQTTLGVRWTRCKEPCRITHTSLPRELMPRCSGARRGDRTVDVVLRKALRETKFPRPKLGGTIQTANSLRGACVVQGLLLAKYLSETSWGLTITESHPRALSHLLHHMGQQDMIKRLTAGLADYTQYATRCLCGCEEAKKPPARLADHKRDATLSAISAWAAIYPTLPKWEEPLR